MRTEQVCAIACVLLAVACSSNPARPAGGGTDSRSERIRLEWWSGRGYDLHLPSTDTTRPQALVLVLHGTFSSGRAVAERSGFDDLADREGFVVAYPDGYGAFGWLRHWNAGHCCGSARWFGIDDVGFLDRVIDDVARFASIDPRRIFVVGESNGGMMAHRYAAERSKRVAGAAAVAGTIGSRQRSSGAMEHTRAPVGPVPFFIVHGRNDEKIPYAGSAATDVPAWLGVADAVAFWRKHDAATSEAVIERVGRVETSTWFAPAGPRVVLASIDDWGHVWPGPDTRELLGGFDAAERIWHFFRRVSGPPVAEAATPTRGPSR